MKSPTYKLFAIDFLLLAFIHCRDVLVAVSQVGGMDVLGATAMTPEQLEIELNWIEEYVNGKPYGVDLIMYDNVLGKDETPKLDNLISLVSSGHPDFGNELLASYGIDGSEFDFGARPRYMSAAFNIIDAGASELLRVAFSHPIELTANALGAPQITCLILLRPTIK